MFLYRFLKITIARIKYSLQFCRRHIYSYCIESIRRINCINTEQLFIITRKHNSSCMYFQKHWDGPDVLLTYFLRRIEFLPKKTASPIRRSGSVPVPVLFILIQLHVFVEAVSVNSLRLIIILDGLGRAVINAGYADEAVLLEPYRLAVLQTD